MRRPAVAGAAALVLPGRRIRLRYLSTLVDRDAEAEQLLVEAAAHLESAAVAAQLYAMQFESRRLAGGRRDAGTLRRCWPRWPIGRICAGSPRSDRRSPINWATCRRQFTTPGRPATVFSRRWPSGSMIPVAPARASWFLPVGFRPPAPHDVRWATLSALSRFWPKPADHLQVAEEICYNGTSAYNERKLAETHGWVTREFTVTQQSAADLLARGVPFTLTTTYPGGGHLQAVIGVDEWRGTFRIRDPFQRNAGEAIADKLLEQHRAGGLRGMAPVPVEERARLAGLDLPDAPLWDRLHELDAALVGHRRAEAEAIADRLDADAGPLDRCGSATGSPATTPIRRRSSSALLASSSDRPTMPACSRKGSPACGTWPAAAIVWRPTSGFANRAAHPVFLRQWAEELRADARRHAEAIALLRRALRCSADAANYHALANVLWDDRRFDEAFELYRFAACLNDKEEAFARSYFRGGPMVQKDQRGTSLPARPVPAVRPEVERPGLHVGAGVHGLEPARGGDRRGGGGDAAAAGGRRLDAVCGRDLRGSAARTYRGPWRCCKRPRGPPPCAYRPRTAARLAAQTGRTADALEHWRQLLAIQPLAIDVHQALVNFWRIVKAVRRPWSTSARRPMLPPAPAVADALAAVAVRPGGRVPRVGAAEGCRRASPRRLASPRVGVLSPGPAAVGRGQDGGRGRRPVGTDPSLATAVGSQNTPRREGALPRPSSRSARPSWASVDFGPAIDEWMALCTTLAQRREVLDLVQRELGAR